MALGVGPFLHLTRKKVVTPLAVVLIALYAWLGATSFALLHRVARHNPIVTSFASAINEARDHDLYARVDGAVLDCNVDLHGDYGDAYAMTDEKHQVAAMIVLDHPCKDGVQTIEAIFRRSEKPGVYGFVASRWDVTQGRLVWVDLPSSKEDWVLVVVALFGMIVMAFAAVAVFVANKRVDEERIAWRMRTIGLVLLAQMPWLAAFGRGWEVWHFLSLPTLAVIGSVTAILLTAFPRSAYFKKVARNWGITAENE